MTADQIKELVTDALTLARMADRLGKTSGQLLIETMQLAQAKELTESQHAYRATCADARLLASKTFKALHTALVPLQRLALELHLAETNGHGIGDNLPMPIMVTTTTETGGENTQACF